MLGGSVEISEVDREYGGSSSFAAQPQLSDVPYSSGCRPGRNTVFLLPVVHLRVPCPQLPMRPWTARPTTMGRAAAARGPTPTGASLRPAEGTG